MGAGRRRAAIDRAAGYPPEGTREHEDAHRAPVARFGTLVRHCEASAGDDDLAEVVREIADLPKHRLVEHPLRFDLPLKPYLTKPFPRRGVRLAAPRATAARFWAARA